MPSGKKVAGGYKYPTQAPMAYPTAPGYPGHAAPAPGVMYQTNPSAPLGMPPPYTPTPHYGGAAYPQTQAQPMYQPQYYPQAQYVPPGANTTVIMPDGYNAGARFDGVAQQVVPPPPPGVAPNAAQYAAMQGNRIIMGQQRSDTLGGGSGGGYVWF